MIWIAITVLAVVLMSDIGRDPFEIAARKERERERNAESRARRVEASKRFYSWPFAIVAALIWAFSVGVIVLGTIRHW